MSDGPIAWIFLIVGLIFIFGGSKKLADLGKGFGSFMREFNKARKEGEQIESGETGSSQPLKVEAPQPPDASKP